MYQQVIEAIAVFASHGNSGGSAPWEINLVQKLCDWDIIILFVLLMMNGAK